MRLNLPGAIALVAATGVVVGCSSKRSETDERVARLEQQLAETQKELAASKPAPEGAPDLQPIAPPAAPRPAPAAAAPKKPASAPTPPASPPDSQKYVTTERGQQAAEQYAKDKTAAQQIVEQQQAVNAQQTETNAQVQQQLEQLKPREYTLPAGTPISVRTTTELSTSKLSNGSTFDALLERDIKSGDTLLAKAGTHVTGVVVSSDEGGRVKGTASLSVALRSIVGPRGTVVGLQTDSYETVAESTKKKDATRTGIATGIGAIIGGIAGGGKGAAIGAGAGAAAGVGTNMATRGAAAIIPAESLLEFRLTAPVTVIVQPH
jgi:type IV secretory pathway VirB10-like protein